MMNTPCQSIDEVVARLAHIESACLARGDRRSVFATLYGIVTREIRDLEASLGLALFDRHPRGVTPTEGGQRLLQFAERIFALEQAA